MTDARDPQPGDVIWADRIVKGLPFNHCGIYEGGGYVIHFAAPEGSEINQENAVIHRTTFDVFKDDCPIKIVEFPEGYSAEETLRRARGRIGERGYDFTANNCDHFATWCKTGEHHSLQVDEAKTVIKAVGGELGELVCAVHGIAETFKAAMLHDRSRIEAPRAILEGLDVNDGMAALDPPVAVEAPADAQSPEDVRDAEAETEAVKYEIIEDPPDVPPEAGGGTAEEDGEADDGVEAGGEGGPVKKPWYQKAGEVVQKVGKVLKKLTVPIAAALEIAKRVLPVPPFIRAIPFAAIGAKVRNTIDKVVTGIKVFTGRLTPQQGRQEMQNNETALLGSVAAQKQKQPVLQEVKQVFGKAGSFVRNTVQQAVTRIVPAPVREAIKTGFQKVGGAIVSGIKTAAKVVGGFVQKVGGFFKKLLFG
jgi:hypothetical protein